MEQQIFNIISKKILYSIHPHPHYYFFPFQANRAISEHNSMGSRHRRKSVPSFASNILGSTRGSRRSRSSPRAGSIDPLLDGSLSDGAESGTLHLSVSRGDLDR